MLSLVVGDDGDGGYNTDRAAPILVAVAVAGGAAVVTKPTLDVLALKLLEKLFVAVEFLFPSDPTDYSLVQ